ACHEEPDIAHLLDHPWHRLQRNLKALFVDQAAHEQYELLIGRGEASAKRLDLAVGGGMKIGWVDPVRDHGYALLLDREDVRDLLTHVGGAGDHLLGSIRHPVLDTVNMALGMLVDPALVTPVLGRMDRDGKRRPETLCEVVARHSDEPVVAMDEVD